MTDFTPNEHIRNETNTGWKNTEVTGYTRQISSTNDFANNFKMLFANLSTSQELAKKRTRNKRKAVVVGIDKYIRLPEASLAGCVNDAKDFANTLLVLGFPPTRIQILTNEKATRANIEKKLEWLVKDAKPGDVLIYYHSGHGSNIADLDNDEEDKRDEMLITSDFVWGDPNTHLTDDTLHKFFTGKTPEGVRCEVVLDTCYSGSGTKSLHRSFSYDNTNAKAVRTSRFLPPPLEQRMRLNTMIPAETKTHKLGEKALAKTQNNTLWSACLENQLAWELMIGDEVRGAFSYNFCQILRRSNGNKTRRNIYQILRNGMANEGYEQIPDLEIVNQEAYEQYPFRRSIEDDSTEIHEE